MEGSQSVVVTALKWIALYFYGLGEMTKCRMPNKMSNTKVVVDKHGEGFLYAYLYSIIESEAD